MVSTSYPLEVKIPPPLCGNCAKLHAELEAKDKRIADAPHGPYCQSTTEQGICDAEELCDCWKKEASDEDAR